MTLEEHMKLALHSLCAQHGSVEAVADKAGVSAENLKQILAGTKLPSGRPRGMGPTVRRKLEEAFPGWSVGGAPVASVQSPKSSRGVAHDLSQAVAIVDPRQLDWEQLMEDDLPETFALVLRDDALGDQAAKGNIGKFSTKAAPIEGRGVLFKDRDGHAYVRIYQTGRGAQWRAISAYPTRHATLESEVDGLTILAVMIGVEWA